MLNKMKTIDEVHFKTVIREECTFSEITPPVKKLLIKVTAQLGTDKSARYETDTYADDYIRLGLIGIIDKIKQHMVDDYNRS